MRMILLQSIDQHWREHLAALDYLRQGIHLRGYAQKNPKQEYKREAFELFSQLLDVVKMDVTRVLMTVRVQSEEEVAQAAEAIEERAEHISNVTYTAPERRRQRLAGGNGRGRGGARRGGGEHRVAAAWRACRRSAATTPVRAAAARSTSTATASWPRPADQPAQRDAPAAKGGLGCREDGHPHPLFAEHQVTCVTRQRCRLVDRHQRRICAVSATIGYIASGHAVGRKASKCWFSRRSSRSRRRRGAALRARRQLGGRGRALRTSEMTLSAPSSR